MHTYIGTQMVIATSMSRGEYVRYLGFDLPELENPEEDGYLVEYTNQPPNHINHGGHISWRPKKVFDTLHLDLGLIDDRPEYQQRVIGERAELHRKLHTLAQYMESPKSYFIPKKELNLLRLQKESMECYLAILDKRIDDFY